MSSESLPIQPLKIQPGDRQCVLKCFKSITFRKKLDYLMEKIYELRKKLDYLMEKIYELRKKLDYLMEKI